MVLLLLYLDSIGLAAARIDVLALRVVMIPAFAIETVCCSWNTCVRLEMEEPQKITNHDFVKDTPSRVRHLVEFVNAADTAVTQDESTTTTV